MRVDGRTPNTLEKFREVFEIKRLHAAAIDPHPSRNMSTRTIAKLGPRDDLVEFGTSSQALKQNPSLPRTFQARLIRYKRRGFDEVTLLTSLRDPIKYPRDEIIALYHERWEIELGYDEIKTELLEREESIHSRKPDGVRQEIWGILLAYNLVRLEIEQVAREA